ncbi:MAG: hypothetical protein AAFY76_17460, partial [Cyanobacteria bacterium J06649_11]
MQNSFWRRFFSFLAVLFLVACNENDTPSTLELSSTEILEKSIAFHDPNAEWDNSALAIHIQEPRLGNPG